MKRNPLAMAIVLALVFAAAGVLLLRTRLRQRPGIAPTYRQLPDIGPRLHQFGRPAVWKSQQMPLGGTGYVAHVGPGVYQDESNSEPDYYTIDVEKSDGTASYVHFQRDFKIDAIPSRLIETPVSEIVSFDEQSRTVTFRIGDQIVPYQLPGP